MSATRLEWWEHYHLKIIKGPTDEDRIHYIAATKLELLLDQESKKTIKQCSRGGKLKEEMTRFTWVYGAWKFCSPKSFIIYLFFFLIIQLFKSHESIKSYNFKSSILIYNFILVYSNILYNVNKKNISIPLFSFLLHCRMWTTLTTMWNYHLDMLSTLIRLWLSLPSCGITPPWSHLRLQLPPHRRDFHRAPTHLRNWLSSTGAPFVRTPLLISSNIGTQSNWEMMKI